MVRQVVFAFSMYIFFPLMQGFGLYASNEPSHGDPADEHPTASLDDPDCIRFKELLQVYNDPATFDSVAYEAIQSAEAGFNREEILRTNLCCLEVIENNPYKYLDFEKLVERTEELSLKFHSLKSNLETWLILSESAARLYKTELANKYALKAFSEANMGKNVGIKVRACLALGNSQILQKHYLEAYQNFLNALYQSEMIDDAESRKAYQKSCHKHLSAFFNELRDFDQAAEYKLLEIKNINQDHPVDSLALYWAKLDMLGIAIRSKKYRDIPGEFEDIAQFALREKNQKLFDFSLATYRTYLIEANDLKGFYDLYALKHPEELKKLEKSDPISYYRIYAYISEYQGNFEMADEYYKQAETLVNATQHGVYQANYYRRYGQFLLRDHKPDEALQIFQKAYDLAKESQYLDYLIESARYIDSLSYQAGDIARAYDFSKVHAGLKEKQNKLVEDEEFMLMALQNESRQMELIRKKKEEELKKKYNLQYFLITFGIIALMTLVIVVNHFRVPEWVIRGSGFLGILMIFEFLILILDNEIHHMTHGAPLWIFIIKVSILFVLFPLHHLVEKSVISYMLHNKLIWKPRRGSLKKIAHKIWPWMKGE